MVAVHGNVNLAVYGDLLILINTGLDFGFEGRAVALPEGTLLAIHVLPPFFWCSQCSLFDARHIPHYETAILPIEIFRHGSILKRLPICPLNPQDLHHL